MRQILVDAARAWRAEKRGAGNKLQFDETTDSPVDGSPLEFLVIHDALERLNTHKSRLTQVIELRYFGGLRHVEIGESLAISPATVKRDLALGEAWLRRALKQESPRERLDARD